MIYSEDKKKILEEKISDLPKYNILHLPTPLQKVKGKNFYIKREDLTGLALGGNKSRRYEYFFRDLKSKGFDSVLHCVSDLSNDAAQISAAAKIFGIELHLIVRVTNFKEIYNKANLSLSNLTGCQTYLVPDYYAKNYFEILKEKLGDNLYCITTGLDAYSIEQHNIFGCIAYICCFLEIIEQTDNIEINKIILESGGSSQAGLIFASKFVECDIEIIGNNPSPFISTDREKFINGLIEKTEDILGLSLSQKFPVNQSDVEESYGYFDINEYIQLSLEASKNGVFIDPIYTSDSFKLIDEKEGSIYIHTGGLSNIFTYSNKINKTFSSKIISPPLYYRFKKFLKNFKIN